MCAEKPGALLGFYCCEVQVRDRQRVFIEEYLKDFNAKQAAIRAGYSERTAYSIGQENLNKPELADEIRRRLDELSMSEHEILRRLTEQARGDLSPFFKIVEEWTFFPLPSYDIIDAREVEETDAEGKPNGKKRVSYWVRHIAIDMDAVIDPKYSHLLKKFSDSPKNGLSIELHDVQNALQLLGKYRKMWVDRTSVEDPDGRALGTAVSELEAALKKSYPEDKDAGQG